jgi:hypothetical protein
MPSFYKTVQFIRAPIINVVCNNNISIAHTFIFLPCWHIFHDIVEHGKITHFINHPFNKNTYENNNMFLGALFESINNEKYKENKENKENQKLQKYIKKLENKDININESLYKILFVFLHESIIPDDFLYKKQVLAKKILIFHINLLLKLPFKSNNNINISKKNNNTSVNISGNILFQLRNRLDEHDPINTLKEDKDIIILIKILKKLMDSIESSNNTFLSGGKQKKTKLKKITKRKTQKN